MEGRDSAGDISFTFTVPSVAERDLVISASAEGDSGSRPGVGTDLSCNKAAAAVSQKRVLKRRLSGSTPRRLAEPGKAAGMGSTMAVSRVIESGPAK